MKMKKLSDIRFWISLLLAFVIVSAAGSGKTWAEEPELSVSAEGYCVIDADTGEIVLGKNEDMPFHPASITKVMTLLVAAECCPDLDAQVTVSDWAVESLETFSSTLKPMARPDEVFTMRDLMFGLIMRSSNECGNIIAEYVGGSGEAFAELMNERAVSAGAYNTHFCNAHGLDEDEHLTTAHDMALILKAALENPVCLAVLSAQAYTIPATAFSEERLMYCGHSLVNRTYSCEGVYAGKTGSTRLAGSTMVTAAQRGDRRLIACVMKSEKGCHTFDTITLFEAAFAKIEGRPVPAGYQPYCPKLSDCNEEGFTVTWKVGGDAVRVELPNVVENDDADVMAVPVVQVTGGTVSCRVHFSEHGQRSGQYFVQALAYDAAGRRMFSTVRVFVPENYREAGRWQLPQGFFTQSDGTYYIMENGFEATGWQELEDGVYYFDQKTGRMGRGWYYGSGTRYYLDENGRMISGWLEENGKHYYFLSTGDIAIGRIRLGNEIYYFNEEGVLTGCEQIPQISFD